MASLDVRGILPDAQLVLDTMLQGVVYQDASGEILSMNAAAERILGRTAAELLGRTSASFDGEVVGEDDAPFPETDRPSLVALRTGREVHGVVMGVFNPRRRERRWIRVSAVPVFEAPGAPAPSHVYTLLDDVTERRRFEQELRAREEKLRAAFDGAAIGFAMTTPSGIFVDANPAYCRITGYRVDELRRMDFRQLVHPEDRDRNVELNERMQAGAIPGFVVENRYVRKGGEIVWVRKSVSLGRAEDGAPRWTIALIEDVTERKRNEEQLRDASRRKDEFLAMLSHELRNPLAPIRHATHVLRRAPQASEQAARALDAIDRQSEHLKRLVDDLLDVTRIARGKFELRRGRVDLREVLARAADDHREALEGGGIAFRLELPRVSVWADADATRIAQLVGNLLSNATHFTRPGGAVTLSLAATGAVAELAVRDTGAGIDPGLLPAVFDPFVQGETTLARTHGGLGLGLALVRAIAELHGGGVRAESAGAGRGATFVVRLPAEAAAPNPPSSPARAPGASAPRRVLVVDDNADAAQSMADLFGMAGHEAIVALDGPSALEKARTGRPDVVLCDIGLPGMTGYDVARALRVDHGRRLRLIAVSGYAQPEDVARALEAGFDRHLAKPVDPGALERLVSDGADPDDGTAGRR